MQKDLKDAVKVRIDLAHCYFRERTLDLNTFGSREAMIAELVLTVETFVRGDRRVSEERKQIESDCCRCAECERQVGTFPI